MKYISNSSLILIIGMNKYSIIKDLLYSHNTIPIGNVISNKNNYNYIPSIFIHEEYNKTIIKNFMKNNGEKFLIFDNYSGQIDKYLQKLFKDENILCILSLEYITSFHNKLKDNIEYLFILREDLQINRKKIYEEFKKYINLEFTVFCKFLDEYIDNNNFLIFDLKSTSTLIQDRLYWYNFAIIPDSFKMCCNEAWNYNDTNNNLIKSPFIDNNKILFDRNFLL